LDSNADKNTAPAIQVPVTGLLTVLNAAWALQARLKKRFETEPTPASFEIPLFELFDVFDSIDIKIVDLTGREYSEGLAVEIVGVVSDPGVAATRYIVEMVRPVVSFHNEVIQTGKVVLGRGTCGIQGEAGETR